MIRETKEARCQRLNAMVDEVLPIDFHKEIHKNYLADHHYFLFNRMFTLAYCSACNQSIDATEAEAMKLRHNIKVRCPRCGAKAAAKCVERYKSRRGFNDFFSVQLLQRTREGIVCRVFRVNRDVFFSDNAFPERKVFIEETHRIFNDGKRVHSYKNDAWIHWLYHNTPRDAWWRESQSKNYLYTSAIFGVTSVPCYDYRRNRANILMHSFLRYAPRDKWNEYYARWVQPMEYLEKAGMSYLAKAIWNGARKGFDFNARTLHEFLRVERGDLPFIRDADLRCDELNVFKRLKKQGVMRVRRWMISACVERDRSSCFRRELEEMNIEEVVKHYENRERFDYHLYFDYIAFCRRLGYDLTVQATLYPKDIKGAHDHLMELCRKEDKRSQLAKKKKIKEKIRKRFREEAQAWQFEADGYQIMLPRNADEIQKEGIALNHCVGNYIERVANGHTTILFVRSIAEPDTSLATMEVRSNTIIQIRAKQNSVPAQEVLAFTEKYKQTVLSQKMARVKIQIAG